MATAATAVPPLTAHLLSGPQASAATHVNHQGIHLSRAQVPWPAEVWTLIDRAVAHEVHRTSIAAKFMPEMKIGHHVTNVEQDMQDIVLSNLNPGAPPFVPELSALKAADQVDAVRPCARQNFGGR